MRHLSPTDLRSVIDDMEHRRLCSATMMRRVADELNTPGRPWVRRFLAVLDARPGSGVPESHWESRVVGALIERGITDLTPQRWLDVPNWGRVRLDASVDCLRWGVEIDVHPEHFGSLGADRDRNRDLACDAIGWRISRVAEPSLRSNFEVTIDRLMAVYHRRQLERAGHV